MESMDLGQAEDILAQNIQRRIRIRENFNRTFLVSRRLNRFSTSLYIRENFNAIAGRKYRQKRMF
jgi:hypothetical protein